MTAVPAAAEAPLPPLAPPSSNSGLLGVFKQRYLLRLLVKKEVQARYSASVLGMLWSYVQPGVRFLMYFFVVGLVLNLHKDVPNFGIHMFTGLVFVHYFTETFTAGTRSIVRNKTIVQKMAMPREMFPVASMLVSAVHVVPQLVILVLACGLLGWTPDAGGVVALALAMAIVGVLGTSLALVFSAANVFFRDFSSIVSTVTIFVTFSVPMIYPYSKVAERFGALADVYLLNPIAEAVLLAQRAFWIGTGDDPAELARDHLPDHLYLLGLAHLGAALILLVISQLVFARLEGKFAERL